VRPNEPSQVKRPNEPSQVKRFRYCDLRQGMK
jgi:hypothetical protein